jgi:hypothetical protein
MGEDARVLTVALLVAAEAKLAGAKHITILTERILTRATVAARTALMVCGASVAASTALIVLGCVVFSTATMGFFTTRGVFTTRFRTRTRTTGVSNLIFTRGFFPSLARTTVERHRRIANHTRIAEENIIFLKTSRIQFLTKKLIFPFFTVFFIYFF